MLGLLFFDVGFVCKHLNQVLHKVFGFYNRIKVQLERQWCLAGNLLGLLFFDVGFVG